MSEEFKNFDELFRVDSKENETERNARVRREAHAKESAKTVSKLKGDLSGSKKSGDVTIKPKKSGKSGKIKSTMGGSGAKHADAGIAGAKADAGKSAKAKSKKADSAPKAAPKAGSAPSAPKPVPKTEPKAAPEKSAPVESAAHFKPERNPAAPAAAPKRTARAEKAKKREKEIVVPENWTPSEPPIRQRRDGRSGCLGGIVFFAFVLSLSIILACVGWMAASDVLALNKEPITATVTLDKAEFKTREEEVEQADGTKKKKEVRYADLDYVSDVLKDAGIIEYKGLFKLYCRFAHASGQIDPGTYELSTNFDYRALVKKMQVGTGAMVTTKVTIPEGFSMEQIFRRLEEEGICAYDDLMDAAANYKYNYSFLDEAQIGNATRLEGFLFPDTYEFYQGMQASSAINKFLVNFHNRLTKEIMDVSASHGFTLQQTVTLASMIEKEAANDEERALISSVIYNRLNQNMPLQIDSTIMYVLPEHGDVLTEEQTHIDSPYNTYQNTGLPPTPIANPGLASINAAIKPAQTSYLYYALDAETGTHQFFNSYGEFQAFVARQSYSG